MSTDVYPDSSFLVSLYRHDGNYAAAAAFMQKRTPFLIFTPLHRVELRNALRNAETQGFVTADERRKVFNEIEQDIRDGFLEHVAIAWSDICRRADDLSEKYSAKRGQRAIDLLHVAAALESGAKLFLSFDQRQRGLAKAAGLLVKP